jgi:hypothetical protein
MAGSSVILREDREFPLEFRGLEGMERGVRADRAG